MARLAFASVVAQAHKTPRLEVQLQTQRFQDIMPCACAKPNAKLRYVALAKRAGAYRKIFPSQLCRYRHAPGDEAALVLGYRRKRGANQKMAEEFAATERQLKRLQEQRLGEAVFATVQGAWAGWQFLPEIIGPSGLYVDGFSQRGVAAA